MSALEDNIAKLDGHLARFRDGGILNRVAGEDRLGSGGTFETVSPVDESVICAVARGTTEDVDEAARAAADAFPLWRDMAATERRRILRDVADAIEARAEEIALCECWDTGQALRFMSKAALRGAENFRYFADMATSARDGQNLPSPTLMNVTTRVPIGPVGVITPWNTPFMLSTWKIAPALAAGCTVVHKPAEASPLTARLLVEIAEGAGLPPGVLNTVNGFGEEAGAALTEHPLIRAIAFVGESRTGSIITKQGADTLKRMHLELGGKNPVVVFADADLERALDAVVFMIFSVNGERCTSSSRLLVEESIGEEFEAKLAERTKNVRVGHPLDPETEVGPLISREHFDKVVSYFDTAREGGATIAAGGERVGEEGFFVRPTLFTGATNDMRIAREEIFGPVLTSIPFRDEEEALRIANDTPYGLTAYVWTSDLTRALRFTDKLEAGMIWVNSENVRHLPTPFGGVKASGIGRDGGDHSFEFYMEQKHIGFATGEHRDTEARRMSATKSRLVPAGTEAVPPFVLDPPFDVLRISHVELGVSDLAASRAFWADTLGMQVTDEDGDTLYLRAMEERQHHSVKLVRGEPEVRALCYRTRSEEDLDRAAHWLENEGLSAEMGRAPPIKAVRCARRTRRASRSSSIMRWTGSRTSTRHYGLYRGVKPLQDRPFQLLLHERGRGGRLLPPHRLPHDGIHARC